MRDLGRPWETTGMQNVPAPTSEDVGRVVEAVVETVQPLRVVLFGSMARGEPANDIDLMVVMPEGSDCDDVSKVLFAMERPGVRVPVDFIVTTPSQYERLRQRHTLVHRRIAQEGRELYAAA